MIPCKFNKKGGFSVCFAVHLARFSRKSVPGVSSCRPPGTVFPQKCSRCLFLPSTWHGFPAKVFQVSFPAVHLPRFSRKSVPDVFPCRPPATVSPRKHVRCPFPPSTCHGFPAKVFQVASPCLSLPSTWHGIPAKVFQVSFSAAHLARNSCKSVPGVLSRRPLATETLRNLSDRP